MHKPWTKGYRIWSPLAALQGIKQEFLLQLHSIPSLQSMDWSPWIEWGETEAEQLEFLSIREGYTAPTLHL